MAASLTTVPGGTVDFSDEQLVELGMLFRGPIVGPDDPSYDQIRVVENLAIDRRPGLIIRCSGEADVIDGVNLAREHGMLLAIRAGGHHVAGHGTVDGGLVLDLRDMNGVWVDPANKTVRVQEARPGDRSTGRPKYSAWPSRAAWSRLPASPV